MGKDRHPFSEPRRPAPLSYVSVSLDPRRVHRQAYFILDPGHQGTLVFNEAAERVLATAGDRRVIWVTSTGSGRGTSLMTLNLASALALDGRVAIVDLRFDAPGVAKLLGIENTPTIERAYAARCGDLGAPVEAGLVGNRLVVLTTDGGVGSEMFGTEAFASVIAGLNRRCDFVLLDGPPIRSLLEREALMSHADGLIVVASPSDLGTGLFEQTLQIADERRVVGCLINEN